jgi:hypothetical protein
MNSKSATISLFCGLFLFVSSVSSIDSFGCTLAISPLKGFDKSEYVFIGEVFEVVGPFESEKFFGKAWGLRVKVVEPIYIPKAPSRYFEVFDYGLASDCSTLGMPKDEISKSYPIGSIIKVIAKEAKLLPSTSSDDNLRLEIFTGSLGSISRNSYEDGKPMTSAHTVFDYRAYKKTPPKDWVEDIQTAYYFLPQFEVRKDILRLERAKTQAEKIKILERMLYYPNCCNLDYHQIVKTYINAPNIRRTLIKKREKVDR